MNIFIFYLFLDAAYINIQREFSIPATAYSLNWRVGLVETHVGAKRCAGLTIRICTAGTNKPVDSADIYTVAYV